MEKFYRIKFLALLLLASVNMALGQDHSVQGSVTSELSGEPLIGANVVIKGTTSGTVTDIDGTFNLTVPGNTTLVVSSVGFLTREIQVNSSVSDLSIQLQEDVADLEEIVVTGLATSIKRSNLANNVSTVDAQAITGTTTQSTLDGALYGKLTGVNINAAGGAPGGQTAMRLRGISSLSGNNQPLFIIDGVYISNVQLTNGSFVASGANAGREEGGSNRVSDINPDDIETIEVLKGASAAAIYGTRANAGVVIITTKRGKEGKTSVSFNQDFGFNTIQNYAGRRVFTPETVESTFGPEEREIFEEAQAAGRVFNYEEELYGEKGFITDSRLSLSGGNERTGFYVNASHRDEDAIMENTGYRRTSLRLNLDHDITEDLSISFSGNYVDSKADRGPVGNENNGGFSVGYNLALTTYDWENLFPDENGVYADGRASAANVLFNRDKIENSEDVSRYIQGVKIDWTAFQEDNWQLKFVANGGLDFFLAKTFVYMPETHQTQRVTTGGFISSGNNTSTQLNYQAFAVFDYFTDNDISINGQFGVSYLNFESDAILSQTTQLVPTQTNLAQGNSFSTSQRLTEEEEFGIIAQGTVNWADRIIATAGMRWDKSDLNGDPNKYFAFPRASLAVNIANFDFWTSSSFTLLKLRVAYGETGSSARFGSLYTPLAPTSVGGLPGLALPREDQNNISAQLGNPDLEPETSQETEYGFDLAFLNGRIGLEFTGYVRRIKDVIYPYSSIPLSSGFNSSIRTDFDLKNTGIEIAVNAQPIAKPDFSWNTSLNYWYNEAEVEELGVGEFQPDGEGFSLTFGSTFIRKGESALAIAANIGEVDADGQPLATIIGDAAPDFQMSWYNQITLFKRLDVNFLFHLKEGGDVLNLTKLLSDFGGVTPDLDNPDVIENPRFSTNGAADYIEDGSYLRLREVGLFYELPVTALGNVFQNIRVGVSGKNLWTSTDYTGYDPETSAFGPSGLSQGIEVAPFPSAKQYYFHLGLRF